MNKTISIALLCGAVALTGPASSQPSQTSAYHYVLPLTLALEAATEAVRVCAQHGYGVSATVVNMDGVPQVAASRRWSHHPYGGIEFRKGFHGGYAGADIRL